MKQATRIARRLEKQQKEEQYQAFVVQRLKEKESRARKEFLKLILHIIFWPTLFIVPFALMIHHDNIEKAKTQNLIDSKMIAWNKYRDKNCKEVEKLFAMEMGSGKFHYVDNGTVYQCNDGLKYTLSDRAAKGELGIDSIPEVKQ